MILGIGIDIIEVARIEASYERFGERFLNRILLPNEISYCLSHKAPGPFLAARFADDFLTDLRGDLRADFFALDLPDFLDELERVDALAMVCYRVRVSAEK